MSCLHFVRRHGALCLVALALAACGGKDGGNATVRLLNATTGTSALDLTTATGTDADTVNVGNVALDTVSDYAGASAAAVTMKVKNAGDSAALFSASESLAKDTPYTAIAWGRDGAVQLRLITDNEPAPAANVSEVRVFNGASDVGAVDIYLTGSTDTLDTATPVATNVASGLISGFNQLNSGSYRLRVTGTGDKTDLRLDVPAVTFASQDRTTLVLEAGSGGVLVHALALVQQGAATAYKNTSARARVVASVGGNGPVTATVGSTALSNALISPAIGNYVLVPAGSQTLLAQVNGATVASATTAFTAGADYTVLVYGDATTSTIDTISDDNRLPTDLTRAKMRLVHGATGYATLSLALDSVSVADDVGFGQASAFGTVTADTGNALIEVTSPLSNVPVYTTAKTSGDSGVTIAAGGVYTVFMLGGNDTPRGVLRKER